MDKKQAEDANKALTWLLIGKLSFYPSVPADCQVVFGLGWCPLAHAGHLLLCVVTLHFNTHLQLTGSLFILIALASFAVCH